MQKFLITRKSENPKTGPIMVTTSPSRTCPLNCPLRKSTDSETSGACYAEYGALGNYIWPSLDRTPAGKAFQKGRIKVHHFSTLLDAVRKLPAGSIWRHNQAGDLESSDRVHIDRFKLKQLVLANRARRGFTYTHYDVLANRHNWQAVAAANRQGFTINLSADTLEHADELAGTQCGPVVVILPEQQTRNTTTPAGRKVVVCPANNALGVTCATCQLCARQRNFIIGFPAHGRGKSKIK